MSSYLTKKHRYYNSYYEARKRAGLTLKEAARRAGVARTTIWSWENGRSSSNIEALRAVAQTYGCTLGQLIAMDVLESDRYA